MGALGRKKRAELSLDPAVDRYVGIVPYLHLVEASSFQEKTDRMSTRHCHIVPYLRYGMYVEIQEEFSDWQFTYCIPT